jgi:hypothetical protein
MIATIFPEAKVWVNSIVLELDMDMSNPADRFGYDTDMGACILSLAGLAGVFLNSQILYPDGDKP